MEPAKRSCCTFGLDALTDLPGLDELRGAGLIDDTLPADFSVPVPSDDPALRDDEEPLGPEDLDLGLAPRRRARRGINCPAAGEIERKPVA